jgi:hypothetical protein
MRAVFADDFGGDPWTGLLPVEALGAVEARLLWAVRRMVLMQPIGAARCHAVHIALQQDFGETGLGIEHLLRCILVGLARVSVRRLAIGAPGCGVLMPDEAVLLALIDGSAGRADLAALAGTAEAAGLLPLFLAVSGMAQK